MDETTEPTTDEPRYVSIPGVLAVAGVVLWIVSGVKYFQESGAIDHFGNSTANYAPCLLLLAGGCFLVLLAAVMSHHRNEP